MGLFGRGRKLPAQARPPLEHDERVVAWASVEDGVLVATNRGLWLPGDERAPAAGGERAPAAGRLGWHEIHKANWSGRELVVTPARRVAEGPGYAVVEDAPAVTYRLADPGELPHQVRTRVTRSVGYTAHHPLPGGGGARVVARRVPGVDGLSWAVRYDPGVDHDDPVVREVTGQLVAQARDGVGEP